MPLPEANTTWPPASLTPIFRQMGAWSALYTNDTGNLGVTLSQGKTDRQGVINQFLKFFWNQTSTDLTKPQERKLHIPIASDIASASADLLFSEPPTVTVANTEDTDEKTVERLGLITGPDFQQLLTSAAETSAALGGTYLRAIVDDTIADHPFITKVDADAAIPEFKHGRLVAVTFWHVVASDNGMVTRHLERHETDVNGTGLIVHGLYRGTRDNLGQPVPFTESPATAWLTEPGTVEHLIDGNTISTRTPGLAVAYAPNVTPSRTWRNNPVGAHLGRSDFDGIEPLMDALDEAFSSLMRDIRLGKSMLVVPAAMLDNNGPGQGASFSQDEIFTPVNAAPATAADSKMAVEQVQFNIRVTEHEQTIMLLWNRIIASAGYSAQTFGESMEYRATATEVTSRERRSYMTRDRKIRSFQPALEAIVAKALAMDAEIFKSGAKSAPVRVQFADGVQDDQEALARTASLLAAGLSSSIETRVRLLHKDWDETAIAEEVERIRAENRVPELADPDYIGVQGTALSSQYQE
ncbi:phage portal protein [Acaricomes phytoseiuli]|uniref:phage portal protein n=1 Tax=Acaricomes phytoseiuli TaxID=291968 RepID=UPI00036CC172|nr:phage portal protein [Acaricomes phytoseiuli]